MDLELQAIVSDQAWGQGTELSPLYDCVTPPELLNHLSSPKS